MDRRVPGERPAHQPGARPVVLVGSGEHHPAGALSTRTIRSSDRPGRVLNRSGLGYIGGGANALGEAALPTQPRRATFYLIDLVSQCAAVERLLAGMSEVQKIDWLSSHGRLALVSKHEGPQVFHFTSAVGLEARFFLRNGLFVFLGDHTTFRPDWTAFTPPDG